MRCGLVNGGILFRFVLLQFKYSELKNPFNVTPNGSALCALPNTVGIMLSFGEKKTKYKHLATNLSLGHVTQPSYHGDMAISKQQHHCNSLAPLILTGYLVLDVVAACFQCHKHAATVSTQ